MRRAASLFGPGLFKSCSGSTTVQGLKGALAPRLSLRLYAAAQNQLEKLRNIGISAHIDSGKTTLTERVLLYTGRINKIHEVRGKDGVGAKMDFMDLEREKGITIQSAATHCQWGDSHINVIDTPGHVDFTIEVERALRVLDGAVLVMCGVSGVQSQSITVDRQMKRYAVPRIVFINKLDRMGAEPYRVISQVRQKLHLNAAAVQVAVGVEAGFDALIDIVTMQLVTFAGNSGEEITRHDKIPQAYTEIVKQKRDELLLRLADGDDQIAEMLMEGVTPTVEQIKAAIRRGTLAHTFTPVFMGSALKNRGVQLMLDGVIDYLPSPLERQNFALNAAKQEEKVQLISDPKLPFVGLAFKLDETKFGQLTFMRVYQGSIAKGDTITNVNTDKRVKVPRLVRMHANEMEDIQSVGPGEICAMFGVDCASGHTFATGGLRYTLQSMHVPEPVMSLSVTTKKKEQSANFAKALAKFQREDPTFRVHVDSESGETIISGMGELHLDIYIERMRREYGVEAVTGRPLVAYRETIGCTGNFDYTHKKQTGGSGQYAKVIGYLEPIPYEGLQRVTEFANETVGGSIPPQFIVAVQKGFDDAMAKGPLTGFPITGVRMVVTDGNSHPVDSSEMAFRVATVSAVREGMEEAGASVLEPIMTVEVQAPAEYQGSVLAGINKRKGTVDSAEADNDYCRIRAQVSLNNMFGYASDLRSTTQGKGEFTMEYLQHQPVTKEMQKQLVEAYKKKLAQERAEKK
eukprot:TRINITY_DN473_c0_g1_i1.p1 TRINITY_DN473_c0_g1~~TRINITY_DN473_c0_g1_i1.p1  ORF type:complete len:745 (+),score=287.59 TRINITY_DN473_c0_g1_i1:152-2386(+)